MKYMLMLNASMPAAPLAVLSMVAVTACSACGADSGAAANGASSQSHPDRSSIKAAAVRPAVPEDSALVGYLAWQQEWIALTRRHVADLDATTKELVAGRSSVAPGSIAGDPRLLALVERQREEMQELLTRAPRGKTADALGATLAGIGAMALGPTGLRYVPHRDEAALTAAREKYGEAFVRGVLAHESMINATLGRASRAP